MGRKLLILLFLAFAAGAVWIATHSGTAGGPPVRAPLTSIPVLSHTETPTVTPPFLPPAPAPAEAPSSSAPQKPKAEEVSSAAEAPAEETLAEEAPPEETPVLQYVIEDLSGNVRVEPFGGGPDKPVAEGAALSVGDTLSVPAGGSAVLALNEQTNVQVGPESQVILVKLEGEPEGRFESLLKLIRGSLLSQVENLQLKRSSYEVESAGIVCGVRGTVFEVDNDGEQVQTVTHVGAVAVASASFKEEFVRAGKAFRFGRGRVLHRRAITDADLRRFKGWADRRSKVILKRRLRLETFRQKRLERWKRLKQSRPGNVRPDPPKGRKPNAFLNRPAAQPGAAGSPNPAVNHRGKPTLKQRIEEMKKLRAEKNVAAPPSNAFFPPKDAPTRAVAVPGSEKKTGQSALMQKLKALKRSDPKGNEAQTPFVPSSGKRPREWKRGLLRIFPTVTPSP